MKNKTTIYYLMNCNMVDESDLCEIHRALFECFPKAIIARTVEGLQKALYSFHQDKNPIGKVKLIYIDFPLKDNNDIAYVVNSNNKPYITYSCLEHRVIACTKILK